MATIGKHKAIVQGSRMKMAGYSAWIVWLVVQIVYFLGFRNRVLALLTPPGATYSPNVGLDSSPIENGGFDDRSATLPGTAQFQAAPASGSGRTIFAVVPRPTALEDGGSPGAPQEDHEERTNDADFRSGTKADEGESVHFPPELGVALVPRKEEFE
jgi:hypothetical protein